MSKLLYYIALWIVLVGCQCSARQEQYGKSDVKSTSTDSIQNCIPTDYVYLEKDGSAYPIYQTEDGELFVVKLHRASGKSYRKYITNIDSPIANSTSNIGRIMQSIAKGDAMGLANQTVYPIERPYPLKDIENEKQMAAYFDTLFDDSIRDMLRHATAADWEEVGWRGYMFANGMLWASPDSLTAVNYMSAKEKALFNRLVGREMRSLHSSLRGRGWRPYRCYRDMTDGSVLRVDERKDDYRLALYHKGTGLSGNPDLCIIGTMAIQGSAANEWFTFADQQKTYVIDGDASVLFITKNNSEAESQHELQKCYWLDLIESGK